MANKNTKKLLSENTKLKTLLSEIYNCPQESALERIEKLVERHTSECDGEFMLFSSPGRIEVIGNHTDHNNGKVVAAAVTVDTLAAVTPTIEREIIVHSEGYPDVYVNIDDLTEYKEEYGTSHALVRGVLKGFAERGYNIGGFTATMTSSVFKGAGMSSSASYEVLVTEILNDVYNGGKIDAVTRAIISQYAENVYFGKPSGLMDQTAIALGAVSYIDFKDVKNPVVKKLDWNFSDVSVVVINCGGDHCDLTENYSAIRSEMEAVAKCFGEEKLRFVSEDTFFAAIPQLKGKVSGRAILRAMHFFEENKRVEALAAAIQNGEEQTALNIISASGTSSLNKLQNCYAEGDSSEPIPLALQIAKSFDGVVAERVHGGGFAGTILTFVKNEARDAFVAYSKRLYGEENVFVVNIRPYGAIRIY